MRLKRFSFSAAFFLLQLSFLTGCGGSKPAAPAHDSVATVDGVSIGREEIKRELAVRSAKDPSFKITPQTLKEQLDVMVNRKLMIQEAVRRKLPEQDSFKNAIRQYWEQTLVRLLLDDLTKEFETGSFATEEEIKDYHSRLNSKCVFEIMRGRNRVLIEKAKELAAKGEELTWDEKVGPVTYDDIMSEVLEAAFELKAGDYEIYEKDGVFFLVHVVSKEAVTPPSLDSIREQIKEKVKVRKQRLAFDEWLKKRRENADISVNPEFMNERSANDLNEAAQK